jgi:hypothetical protein
MSQEPLVEVYLAQDSLQAHFLKNLLDDAGIEAHVVGDVLQGALGELPFVAIAPSLHVPSSKAERARQLLLEWEQGRRERSETA